MSNFEFLIILLLVSDYGKIPAAVYYYNETPIPCFRQGSEKETIDPENNKCGSHS
jgi:hypothetical protein